MFNHFNPKSLGLAWLMVEEVYVFTVQVAAAVSTSTVGKT